MSGMSDWRGWWRTALDLVFPRSCAACGAPTVEEQQEDHVCPTCRAALEFVQDPFCVRCGDPIDGAAERGFACSLCTASEPAFDLARSAVRYRGPVRALLHSFKYGEASYLARDLGGWLAACVETHYDPVCLDLVAYVPLFGRRERERAYNQSRLLAAELGRRYGRPVLRGLKRVRDTGSQTRLHAAGRRENVKGAFVCSEPRWVEGKTILLLDDVMTTGATVQECAAALKRAGAFRVLVGTVARG